MKTKCLLRDGPADGVEMEVEDRTKQLVIPGLGRGCSLMRHEYTREGIALFEFVKSVEVPGSEPGGNLDYVLGLRDQIVNLEATLKNREDILRAFAIAAKKEDTALAHDIVAVVDAALKENS